MNPGRVRASLAGLAILVIAAVVARWTMSGRDSRHGQGPLPTLRVLAYESFTGISGPGSKLAEQFEKSCRCKVELLSTSEAGLLVERLRLAEGGLKADVVIGLDELLLDEARKAIGWKPLKIEGVPWEPVVKAHVRSDFVPIDWAPLTFIWRKTEIEAPKIPADLLKPEYAGMISLEDPRTSTPGLHWLFAMHSWAGESQLPGFLQKLKPNVYAISPSWANAYGLFQRRQAKMTFTYVTSLVYHWTVEKDMGYEVANFPQGHPVQIEFMGIPESCQRCGLAEKFVAFLLSAGAQRQIMSTNFMFPVRDGVSDGTAFAQLPKLPLMDHAKFVERRRQLVEVWLKVME